MSLEKAIKSGKEHRKEYIGKNYCKSVDKECRNHGSCPWCQGKRKYIRLKREPIVEKDEWEGLIKELYPIGTVLGFLNLTEDSIEKEEIRMSTIFSGKWKWIGNGPGGSRFERIK